MDEIQDVTGSNNWYRDCEKVSKAQHYCVQKTESLTNTLRRKRSGQTKKMMDAHEDDGTVGDKDNKD